jgi:hypothetical protein
MKLLVAAASLAAAAMLIAPTMEPGRSVYACTGGVAGIEHFAPNAVHVFLGEAIEVGGPTNSAPTVTPTSTPTAFVNSPTPAAASATVAPPTYAPNVDLRGIGATFRVVADYSGIGTSEFVVDNELRSSIEQQLREAEAGKVYLSTCAIDAFVPRYTQGARYLVFTAEHVNGAYFGAAVFRVEGERIVFNDQGLAYANNGFLHMQRATYDRYFAGLPASEPVADAAYFTDGSVPLRNVLHAVAALRGDASIAPPDTGSAGLKTQR